MDNGFCKQIWAGAQKLILYYRHLNEAWTKVTNQISSPLLKVYEFSFHKQDLNFLLNIIVSLIFTLQYNYIGGKNENKCKKYILTCLIR